MSGSPIETERKYLIRYPDTAALAAMEGARVLSLRQTYLLGDEGVTARVRRTEEAGRVRYTYTEKRRISALSAYETEYEISAAEYDKRLAHADPARRPIEKTRYVIPCGALRCEIDVYPFWQDRAILEIELPREDTPVVLPDYVSLIADVSGDARYKNSALAVSVPQDERNHF
ncbi:MAG: hypothetical protein ACI3XP_05550 [Eubacteriales bacterium]